MRSFQLWTMLVDWQMVTWIRWSESASYCPTWNAQPSRDLVNCYPIGGKDTYSDGKNNNSSNNYHLGLVSQEVEQVVPEAVKIMPDSLLSVSYSDLVPLLVEAMKEQQGQISELQMALLEQEAEITKIKSRRWFKKRTK